MILDPKEKTLSSLRIDGDIPPTQLLDRLRDGGGSLSRSIEEAPTVTFQFLDLFPYPLLNSDIFTKRITTQVDGRSFELAKVGKSGSTIAATFEDVMVAELRRRDAPIKVAANTMTRIQFAQMLLKDTPWIPLIVNPIARAEITKVELARGTVGTAEQEERREDTWTCLKRIFAEINWNCYIDGGVCVGPDYAYVDRGTTEVVQEGTPVMNSAINFDWDIGKPVASCNFSVITKRWAYPPGTPVEVKGQGPANGVWIVSRQERPLFGTVSRIDMKRPEPDLPEPEGPPEPKDHDDRQQGGGSGESVGGSGGSSYRWPVSGSISSNFGTRGGRMHNGLDIAAPTGRTVVAARGGTVSFAGSQSGYGNVVYIKHDGGHETRYAHLSRISTRRGAQVGAGTTIGAVGSTGNSTGPHLHLEIRIGGKAVNPRNYLR